MNKSKDTFESQSSLKTHTSYSLGSFYSDFLSTVLSLMVFKFYETEIFLPLIFITIGIVIYGIWNMLNDPFAGYISERNIGFMKKMGKRFTWFLITALPSSIIFFLIFIPPLGNDIITFLWLIFTLCLLDTLISFATITWQAIFPDKFRSQKERTKVGGIQILFSLIGLALGTLLPILMIIDGLPESYVSIGIIVSIMCFITVILMLHGMREDRVMIKRTFQINEGLRNKELYFQKLKFALKQKNYIAYLFAYLAQTTVMSLMLASVPYWVQYILKTEPFYEIIILLAFLLASVISSPIWIKLARKYGNRIGYMCGTGGTATFLIITMFIWDFPYVIIGFILTGISMGATWTLIYPTFSDVIDEIVIKTGKREEGIYYGFRTFIGRFSIVIQALTFGIIHPLSSFDPQATEQSIQAQWGINIGMFAVPAFFYFIGFLFMWKVSNLTPDRVLNNKKKLIELNL
jgi:GPH family glycoside/pentoside/hexuronide:cation symporter